MLTCPICAKEFKNFISTTHLKNHNLTRESFVTEYPNSPLKSLEYSNRMAQKKNEVFKTDPTLRARISEATKKAMTSEVIQKIKNRVITDECRLNMSKSAKIRANKQEWKDNLYTEERNKKVSDSKFNYWKTADKIHITNLWKQIKERDEDKWRDRLLDISQLGLKSNGSLGIKNRSKFEEKI
jgi:fumarylacetoacetate (FAA) hydrolase family protein